MIQIPEQGNNSKVAKDLQTKAVGRERERERERERVSLLQGVQ